MNRKPRNKEELDWHNEHLSGKDFVFRSHEGKKKATPHDDWGCYCHFCYKAIPRMQLARVIIGGAGFASMRTLRRVCKDCFPKLCADMGMIDIPDFIEPHYTESDIRPEKQKNETVCHNCEKRCNSKFNFCPNCGTELDK